jgi:hypothetical protein
MAQGDKITNQRLNAIWQVCATLDMNTANSFLTRIKTQPDGVYAEGNMNEMAIWLKWELGRDGSMAKWFPNVVYESIIGKINNFAYNKADIGVSFKPPENAAGGSGQCTCDDDAYVTPARNVVCFKWDFVDFIEQAAGSEAGGTWTFSSLSAGNYILVFDDYLTNESFSTKFLTVT